MEASISKERFATYLNVLGGDFSRALALYEENTSLGEAFYRPLQTVEIVLRNAFHSYLSSKLGRADWYNTRNLLSQKALGEVIAIIERLKDDNKETRGWTLQVPDVVATLSFGFWVGLSHKHNQDELWTSKVALYDAIKHYGRKPLRSDVYKVLNELRMLRNRVAHHRPLFKRDSLADLEAILTVIGWFCPKTADWVGQKNTLRDRLSSFRALPEARRNLDRKAAEAKVAALRLPPKPRPGPA